MPMPKEKALRDLAPDTYVINEVFYSVQGEGILAGTPMVFIRFADCNLRCATTNAGFDCDTEFVSGRELSRGDLGLEIVNAVRRVQNERPPDVEFNARLLDWIASGSDDTREFPVGVGGPFPKWFLLTGGEPALQIDEAFIAWLKTDPDMHVAIETNGTIKLPVPLHDGPDCGYPVCIDHICVSPKTAEHTLRQLDATELKYVRRVGQALPTETRVRTQNLLVSPACQPDGRFRQDDLAWCMQLVLDNPQWRLSVQQHKLLGAR